MQFRVQEHADPISQNVDVRTIPDGNYSAMFFIRLQLLINSHNPVAPITGLPVDKCVASPDAYTKSIILGNTLDML